MTLLFESLFTFTLLYLYFMFLKELRSKEEILTEVCYLAKGALLGNLLT